MRKYIDYKKTFFLLLYLFVSFLLGFLFLNITGKTYIGILACSGFIVIRVIYLFFNLKSFHNLPVLNGILDGFFSAIFIILMIVLFKG